MLNQQVSVDYWAMGRSMLTYVVVTGLSWVLLRLIGAAIALPRKLRAQQRTIQDSLQELQRRFPDLDITEEDLVTAEKELDELIKKNENERKENEKPAEIPQKDDSAEIPQIEEDKKTL